MSIGWRSAPCHECSDRGPDTSCARGRNRNGRRYALRHALEHPAVERVTAIVRRTLGISHTKLNEILHLNFGDCSALAESLSHQDAAIFCLGAYTGSVSDAELRTITVDYTVDFARVLHTSSPGAESYS